MHQLTPYGAVRIKVYFVRLLAFGLVIGLLADTELIITITIKVISMVMAVVTPMSMAAAMVKLMATNIDSNSKAEYIIKSFEGLRLQPYYCPAGLKTIGWGHVIKEYEQQQMSDGISQEHADYLLEQDIEQAKYAIYRHCRVPLNYSQEGALISFVFNCGAGAFQASSLRQKLLRGEYLSAADEFPKWVYARGIKLKGLVRRRLLERTVFLHN